MMSITRCNAKLSRCTGRYRATSTEGSGACRPAPGVRASVFGLVCLFVLAGCASDGPPVSNPSGNVSARKHQGPENEITLFRLFRKEQGRPEAADPVVGDPEYQEYLEWKRWREFKEYQKWQREQGNAAPAQ
jgi:hypothetical protein